MKLVIVALALVAVAVAVPVEKEPPKILRSEFNQDPAGGYNFGYDTEDGSSRSETGEVKQVVDEENKPHQVVIVRGQFSYVNPDGQTETIEYYADESGYHPKGDSIPKANSRR